jgi:hypothetical protein
MVKIESDFWRNISFPALEFPAASDSCEAEVDFVHEATESTKKKKKKSTTTASVGPNQKRN